MVEISTPPCTERYSVSAGPPPRDTWSMDPTEGGGRIIGETCHFVDLCNSIVDAPCTSVYARVLAVDHEVDDSMLAVLSYADGSVCTLEYLAHADPKLPKERFEVSSEGRTASCNNFRVTEFTGRRDLRTVSQDKGQQVALREVIDAVRNGAPSPVPLATIVNVSRVTFAMLESAATGLPTRVEPIEEAAAPPQGEAATR